MFSKLTLDVPVPYTPEYSGRMTPPKSRVVVALLGLVAPGLGQAYVGHPLRGAAWATLPLVVLVGFLVVARDAGPLRVLEVLGASVLTAYVGGIADALAIPRAKHRTSPSAALVAIAALPFVASPVVAIGLRVFVLEAFKVPSGAMIPTIVVGDHFFVDKGAYRNHVPRRGEVIVFQFPERRDQDFVKRAIAVEGDTLEVRGGHPVLNGWEVPSCLVGEFRTTDDDGSKHEGALFVEFLGSEAYLVFLDRNATTADLQGPYVVGAGETWVLGDNRNNSHDSRMWFNGRGGGVPASHVKGRARLVWLSPANHGGTDLGGLPVPPSPEFAPRIDACLGKRPATTLPPPAK